MSTRPRIYLDYNATAPLAEGVRAAVTAALAITGNPSSVHAEGRLARDLVERARRQVAALVGRPREQIVFTSGGTEANWLGVHALARLAERRGLPRVIATTALEHPSLHGAVESLAARGWQVRTAEALHAEPGAGVIAMAAVNHELGTIAPVLAELGALAARGTLVHVDAVQAAGKLPLGSIVADTLAVSAHKLGGPQGVGALVLAADDGLPLIAGGHQERGRRPGTENTLGIVGFGAAAATLDPADWPRVAALGDRLEAGLRALPGVRIHGADRSRVGGTINAGFAAARGEAIVMALDLAGIAASTGAACTSGSVQPSPVLIALGLTPEQAGEAVRFSLGRPTTQAEIDEVLSVLPPIVERARRHGPR
jgi:cysteine desulfurase